MKVEEAQANLAIQTQSIIQTTEVAPAGLNAAKVALASAVAQQAQVGEAGAAGSDRDAAQTALDQANSNFRGAQAKLNQLKAGSTAADRASAQSAVEQSRANLAKLTTDPSPATVELSKAKVHQAELALAEAQLALKDASLVAPFDGVVTSIALRDGDIAGVGTTVLTVADLATLRFETKDLDEISASQVHVGQSVLVTVPALDKKSFEGTVSELASEPTITQSGDVNYVAKISLKDPPADLHWGQTARVEFK